MSNKSSQKIPLLEKLWAWLFACAILGLIIVSYSVSETKELPMTIIGAVLGVAMTVFATFFLFKGQSQQQVAMVNEELRQEKEVEIFKARLKAYESFMDALSAYLQTKQEADKSKLKFHTAALAMHGDLNKLADVNRTVKTIIDEGNGENNSDITLIPALFHLSELFRAELYPEDNSNTNRKIFTDSINEFAKSVRDGDEAPDQATLDAEDAEQTREIENASSADVIEWDSYVNSLKGWKVTCKNGNIKLEKADSNMLIEFKLKSGYYIVASSNGDDKEYTIKLKNRFKGSYRSGTNWWRPLNTLRNYRVKAGALPGEISTNAGARAVVINWIDKINELID